MKNGANSLHKKRVRPREEESRSRFFLPEASLISIFGEILALCGSEVLESGQLSRCDVCPQGLLDDLDRIEAALF